MGLDFGLTKMKKTEYKKYLDENDRLTDAFYEDEEKVAIDLINYCGWDNPAEKWFKFGLNWYDNDAGYRAKPITQDELFAVIREAISWEKTHHELEPLMVDRAYQKPDEDTIKLVNIDGIKIRMSNDCYTFLDREDLDNRAYLMSTYVDPWYVNFPIEFINTLVNIALEMDWENEVLLYYISY